VYTINSMEELRKNKHRRYTIGILADPVFRYRAEQVIAGVEAVARDADCNILCFSAESIYSSDNISRSAMLSFDIINKKNVDGLIVMSEAIGRYAGVKCIGNLVKKYYPLPLVSLGMKIKNVPSVVISREKGLKELITHLVKRHNRKRIALVLGPKDNQVMQDMEKMYLKILKQYKLEVGSRLLVHTDFDYYSGKEAVRRLTSDKAAAFDAVISLNDEVCLGIIMALQEQGIRVPGQVSVAGFEDQKYNEEELLPLTVESMPFHECGRTAADLIIKQIRGEKTANLTTIPTELIVRESCGCINVSAVSEHDSVNRVPHRAPASPVFFSETWKQRVLSGILRLYPRLGARKGKIVRRLCLELIDAFAYDITHETCSRFLLKWKEYLYQHIAGGINISTMLRLLSVFRAYSRNGDKDPVHGARSDTLIHQAALIAGKASEKADTFKNLKAVEQGRTIEEVQEELLMALGVDKLASIVCEKFPLLGVESCFISLYEEVHDPLQYSRLLIALVKKRLRHINQKDVRFLTNRLVPPGLLPAARRFTFFIETLCHENEPLGLLVLELTGTDLKICDFLKKRLSTAIKGVKRLEEVKIQAQNLENLVSSRTFDLSNTNRQLQEEILVRLRTEEELRKSEERYRRWFEDDFTGDFIADAKGDILACNPAFAKIFGFTSVKEAMKANFGDFYPNKSALEDFFTLLNVVKRIEYYEAEFLRPNGSSIHVIGNIIGSFDKKGNLLEMRGYLFDNTERKNLEEELRQSHKMEAIGRLAGGIAHDFNNLLTGIMGYSEIMLQALDGKSALRREVEEIKKAGKSAASLTRQLLAFSRKQVLQPTLLNLNDVIMDMNEMLKRLIGEHIRLVTRLDADLANVKADRGQIEQVIMNLVLNSRDALPHGGEILIESGSITVTEASIIHIPDIQTGKYIVISVSDNGIGMNPEIQSHIFEPFFTTKKEGKGVGLGLSTVYGIITQSGGYTGVLSEPGKGTTVRIYLSQFEEAAIFKGMESIHPERVRLKKTILIVEDEQIVRDLAKKVLVQAGYRVLSAKNGRDALLVCKRMKDEVDLLVSDVIMPGMNGLELAKKMFFIQPKIKVLYMSGYSDRAIIHEAVVKKGTNFIQKPFTPEVLLQKVRETIIK
jgi:two-component system cell cycle sensor histidine kinase/response regulator CckA